MSLSAKRAWVEIMKRNELKDLLYDCCHDLSFTVDGKPAGVMPEVTNYKKIYHMWFGTATKDLYDLTDVLSVPFFGGKSLDSLCDSLNFQCS